MQNFARKLNDTLLFYQKEIQSKLDEQIEKSAKELVELTKRTAPVGKRKRHYYTRIKQKPLSELKGQSRLKSSRLWYVDGKDYRLSHLLNNDHAKRGGQGSVHGTKFITKANDKVQREFEESVRRIINDTK